jgi:hypothetical protein
MLIFVIRKTSLSRIATLNGCCLFLLILIGLVSLLSYAHGAAPTGDPVGAGFERMETRVLMTQVLPTAYQYIIFNDDNKIMAYVPELNKAAMAVTPDLEAKFASMLGEKDIFQVDAIRKISKTESATVQANGDCELSFDLNIDKMQKATLASPHVNVSTVRIVIAPSGQVRRYEQVTNGMRLTVGIELISLDKAAIIKDQPKIPENINELDSGKTFEELINELVQLKLSKQPNS